jgi:hypothetical protein
MKRPNFSLRLQRWHEWLVYGSTALLTLTGIAWLLLDRFGKVEAEFGPEPNPALPWLLMAHGIAAYAFVIIAAMLIPVHMRLGWNSGRNRSSGLWLVSFGLFLLLTGLGLYYATQEGLCSATSLAHWIAGLALPLLIVIHLVRGKGSRPKASARSAR